LGACRAGITNVLLPGENLADLEDLSEEERQRLHVDAVDDLRAVLRIALRRPDGAEYAVRTEETELAPTAP
jgi:ATP-dependent Lon protease